MNRVMLMGRLTRDPVVRQSAGENATAFARYTLAVDRRFARQNEADNGQMADFISCVAFGRSAEFAEKYLHQGSKIAVAGRIQTGSYTNRDGQKIYTTDVVVEEQEFAESRSADASHNGSGSSNGSNNVPGNGNGWKNNSAADASGFMNIPEGIDDDLPFD